MGSRKTSKTIKKINYVCPDCRTHCRRSHDEIFRGSCKDIDNRPKCPSCQRFMMSTSIRFVVPKKSDDKAWNRIKKEAYFWPLKEDLDK